VEPKATTPCAPLADPATSLEFEAITTDGHYVVTTPGVVGRVFYGTPTRMVEGTITRVANSCARYVDFDIEGSFYTATFSTEMCAHVVPGRLSLDFDDGGFVSQGLTVLNAYGHTIDGGAGSDGGLGADMLSYVCF
jgi:hypothetical protein